MKTIVVDTTTNEVVGVGFADPIIQKSIEVSESMLLTKEIKEPKLVQKTNELGEKIYLNELGEETTSTVQVLEYKNEVIEVPEIVDGVEITKEITIKVPSVTKDLEPLMVYGFETRVVNLFDEPTLFTVDEVMTAKYTFILNSSTTNNIIGELFTSESDIDYTFDGHKCDTGVYGVNLHETCGKVKSLPIQLAEPTSTFKIIIENKNVSVLVNGIESKSGVVKLDEKVEEISVVLENTTEYPEFVTGITILY